nr:mucin-5B-like [Procambarus clarkii]
MRCKCEAGSVTCRSQEDYCNPQCSHPATPTGQCCPLCDNCLYHDQQYTNGQTFTLSSEKPCQECQCLNGVVRCLDPKCHDVSCGSPVVLAGSCCPTCPPAAAAHRPTDVQGTPSLSHTSPLPSTFPADLSPPSPRTSTVPPSQLSSLGKTSTPFLPPPTSLSPLTPYTSTFLPVFLRPSVDHSSQVSCPSCQRSSCLLEGTLYPLGETFQHPTHACLQCSCTDAGVTCGRVQCPSVPCTHPAVPSDGCCPVCRDCLFTLRIFLDGDTFVHEHDPCQECQCQAGGVRCESVRCPPLQCAVPRVVQGVCCPFCAPPRQCHFHDAYYDNHQVFPHPHDHCQECRCTEGMVSCREQPCPPYACPSPRLVECCLQCDGCSYAGRSLDNHAVFPDPLDPCRSCRCDEGTVSCVPVACPPAYCSRPVTPVGACCPICRECEYDEHVYLEGEVFEASYDACTECRCDYPEVTCYPHVCAPAHCAYPALDARGCCALCKDCEFEGQTYHSGQHFPDPSDPCSQCSCRMGEVQCTQLPCGRPACPYPVPGRCCPQCTSGCQYNGENIPDGGMFPSSMATCQECVCHGGHVTCMPKTCPLVACTHPAATDCCAQCHDCYFEDREIENGLVFAHPRSPCQKCQCLSGSVTCSPIQCPSARCTHPRVVNCCPSCTAGCRLHHNLLEEGETFASPTHTCHTCVCQRGSVECFRQECPALTCPSHQQEEAGECCPACVSGRNCVHAHQVIPHDTHFTDNATCSSCRCVDGNVTCEPVACPSPACSLPRREGGACCPTCPPCHHRGVLLPPDYRFFDPDQPCTLCVCRDGNVKCFPEPCPALQCPRGQNLVPVEGSCCPICVSSKLQVEEAPLPSTQGTTPHPSTQGTTPHPSTRGTTPHPSTRGTTPHPSTRGTTPHPSTRGTTPHPSTRGTTPHPSTRGTTPHPSTRGTTPHPSTRGTTPHPSTRGTTPHPSTRGTTPHPSTRGTTPHPSTRGTTPHPSTRGTTPHPSTRGTTPHPSTRGTTPHPSTRGTTPHPSTRGTTPHPSTRGTTPHPSTRGTTPHPSTRGTTPHPSTRDTTLHPSTRDTTSHPSTRGTTSHPSTRGTTPHPSTRGTTPHPSTRGTTPHPSTRGTTPHPSTRGTTPHPSAQGTTPHPSAQAITPHPSTQDTTPHPSTQDTTPHPSTQRTTLHPSAQAITPHPSTRGTTLHPSAQVITPHPSTQDITLHPSTQDITPHPSTQGTTPHPSTQGTTPHPSTQDTNLHPSAQDTTPHPSTDDIPPHSSAQDIPTHPGTISDPLHQAATQDTMLELPSWIDDPKGAVINSGKVAQVEKHSSRTPSVERVGPSGLAKTDTQSAASIQGVGQQESHINIENPNSVNLTLGFAAPDSSLNNITFADKDPGINETHLLSGRIDTAEFIASKPLVVYRNGTFNDSLAVYYEEDILFFDHTDSPGTTLPLGSSTELSLDSDKIPPSAPSSRTSGASGEAEDSQASGGASHGHDRQGSHAPFGTYSRNTFLDKVNKLRESKTKIKFKVQLKISKRQNSTDEEERTDASDRPKHTPSCSLLNPLLSRSRLAHDRRASITQSSVTVPGQSGTTSDARDGLVSPTSTHQPRYLEGYPVIKKLFIEGAVKESDNIKDLHISVTPDVTTEYTGTAPEPTPRVPSALSKESVSPTASLLKSISTLHETHLPVIKELKKEREIRRIINENTSSPTPTKPTTTSTNYAVDSHNIPPHSNRYFEVPKPAIDKARPLLQKIQESDFTSLPPSASSNYRVSNENWGSTLAYSDYINAPPVDATFVGPSSSTSITVLQTSDTSTDSSDPMTYWDQVHSTEPSHTTLTPEAPSFTRTSTVLPEEALTPSIVDGTDEQLRVLSLHNYVQGIEATSDDRENVQVPTPVMLRITEEYSSLTSPQAISQPNLIFSIDSSESTPSTPISPDTLLTTPSSPDTLLTTPASPDTLLTTPASPDTLLTTPASPDTLLTTTASPDTLLTTTASPDTLLTTTASPDTLLTTTASPDTLLTTPSSPDTLLTTPSSPDTLLTTSSSPDTLLTTPASPDTLLTTPASPDTLLTAPASPDTLLTTPASPDTLLTAPASPDTLLTAPASPDTLLTTPASPDTLLTAPASPDTLLTAPASHDTLLTAPASPDTLLTAPASPDTLLTAPASPDTLRGFCEVEEMGKMFRLPEDPCIICKCSRELSWECGKVACPPLDCPAEELHLPEGECCPACRACEVQVGSELRQYGEGESWTHPIHVCTICVCLRGRASCSASHCPDRHQQLPMLAPGYCKGTVCFKRQCSSGQEERYLPGSCCPVCAPASRRCVWWGQHLRTFDGLLLGHHTYCAYTLAAHCSKQLFTIYTKFEEMARAGMVTVVTVVVGGQQLELSGRGSVVVDGIQVRLPYLSPTLTLYSHGDYVVVNTNVGLQVVWGVGGQVEVVVGGEHAGVTCGLCGNFNNLPQDDLMLPSAQLSYSVEEFLAGWRTGEDCGAPPSSQHCSSSGPSLSGKDSDLAHHLCSILKGPGFRECHRLVPPDPYMSACRREVCQCPGDIAACLCATLNLYSTLCTRAGLVLDWRTPLLCGEFCV